MSPAQLQRPVEGFRSRRGRRVSEADVVVVGAEILPLQPLLEVGGLLHPVAGSGPSINLEAHLTGGCFGHCRDLGIRPCH